MAVSLSCSEDDLALQPVLGARQVPAQVEEEQVGQRRALASDTATAPPGRGQRRSRPGTLRHAMPAVTRNNRAQDLLSSTPRASRTNNRAQDPLLSAADAAPPVRVRGT